jgi:hypothetical protein
MTTITLPESLASRLQQQAALQQRSIDALVLNLLSHALETSTVEPSIHDIVARIKATRPQARAIRSAQGSLADALQQIPDDPSFDLAQWVAEWQQVEHELPALASNDDSQIGPVD